jgi:hypothetical protein
MQMNMSEYLKEIKHAASETLRLVWAEHQQLEELQVRIDKLSADIEASATTVEWLRANPDLDDDFQATAMHWESYFGPEKEHHHAEKSKPGLEALVDARKFSTEAQSASILQYAKQGISLVHGDLAAGPAGRMIGAQPLKNVIWQSRNQALHWEDDSFSKAVNLCFEELARDVHRNFSE